MRKIMVAALMALVASAAAAQMRIEHFNINGVAISCTTIVIGDMVQRTCSGWRFHQVCTTMYNSTTCTGGWQ